MGGIFLLATRMFLIAYGGVLNPIQKPLEQKVKGQEPTESGLRREDSIFVMKLLTPVM